MAIHVPGTLLTVAGLLGAPSPALPTERPYPEAALGGAGDEVGTCALADPAGGAWLGGWMAPDPGGAPDFWLLAVDSTGRPRFEQSFPAPGEDRAWGLAPAGAGGALLVGETLASGGGDARVVRTDADGRLLWERTYGGPELDAAFAVVATPGGHVLAGETRGTGSGRGDGWLVAIDDQGQLAWQTTHGGDYGDRFSALLRLPDGDLAAAGTNGSRGQGGGDLWLVRTQSNGRLIWEWTYGSSGPEAAYALVATLDGGFLLAGDTLTADGYQGDGLLVKTDRTGLQEWSRSLGGWVVDRIGALASLPGGGFLAGGATASRLPGGGRPTDPPVAWLVAVDPAGVPRWERTSALPGSGVVRALCPVQGGGLFAVGSVRAPEARDTQAWLTRLESAEVSAGAPPPLDTAERRDYPPAHAQHP